MQTRINLDRGRRAHEAPFHAGPLSAAPIGLACVVREVQAREGAAHMKQQLEEIGFFPGEHVVVMVRGVPGGDPLAVRVGHSTFALRAAEAACITVDAVSQ